MVEGGSGDGLDVRVGMVVVFVSKMMMLAVYCLVLSCALHVPLHS